MIFRKRTIRWFIVAVAVACAHCGNDVNVTFPSPGAFPRSDFVDRDTSSVARGSFSSETPVMTHTRIFLRGLSGRIEIMGQPDAGSVQVTAELRVGSDSVQDAEANLERLEVQVTDSGGEISVETIQPQDNEGREYTVDYVISIPPNLEVAVTTVNGPVIIDDVNASVSVTSTNGAVELRSITGSASVDLANGRIFGRIALPRNGTIRMSTTNGDIEMAIPRDTSARLTATAFNGTVTVSELVLANQSTTSNSTQGTLGAGRGTIDLATVNGGIRISGF